MEKRSLYDKMFGFLKPDKTGQIFQLLSDNNSYFYKWNGNIFESDIVRSAIRPKAAAVGKLSAKHIRGSGEKMVVNPSAALMNVLWQPNPYMSMQDFLMKMVFQREIYHNAFAYVKRDINGAPIEVYPIPYNNVELQEVGGEMYVKFWFVVGKYMVLPYTDVIHLRKDFFSNDIFGDNGRNALTNVMEVISTTDQGIVNAVKNSAIIKWIMTFKTSLKDKDVQVQVDNFVKNYLSIDKTAGVAVGLPSYELKQVDSQSYVPNVTIINAAVQRLWSYFGVNEFIVQNRYDENQWNAFYESEIQPIAIQLSDAFTSTFFTPREIGFGNRLVFESSALQYASMTTKLGLVAMVDRGAMTPNEWRLVLNFAPIAGGDVPLRRLDTVQISDVPKNNDNGGTDARKNE